MKKLFCIQVDTQKKMYKAHVAAKIARQSQILMMRKMELDVQSGSEKKTTDEEDWVSKDCKWTDSDDSTGATSVHRASARRAARADDEEIAEEDSNDDPEESSDEDAE